MARAGRCGAPHRRRGGRATPGGGLTVRTDVGGRGLVAVLDGAFDGPTIADRADMDAVEADEPDVGDFASRVPGAAHLCGHDVHTTIGVGLGQLFARLRDRLAGRLVLLLQPAEETLAGARAMIDAGARAMIDAGALDAHPPQEIYALHCAPLPVGTFGVMPGNGLSGVDRCRITLSGPVAVALTDQLVADLTALTTVQRPQSDGTSPSCSSS
jgi:metal-dependent amidase/aminoacylase/carboxypeptidase family protein